jgi:hypothetical protein
MKGNADGVTSKLPPCISPGIAFTEATSKRGACAIAEPAASKRTANLWCTTHFR